MALDEDGNPVISNLGTKGYFSYDISWHSSSTNKVRKFYYKPNASSSWTTISLSNDSQTDYNFNNSLASGSGYDLKLEISDQVTTVSQTIQMPYLFPLINLSADGTSIAFGKETNAANRFMVSMDASFNNRTKIYSLEVTGEATCNNVPLKIISENGTGTYYGNQIWLSECLSMASTGSGGTLYLNSAANHSWVDLYGSVNIRGRGKSSN